jgi:hypothetical protein
MRAYQKEWTKRNPNKLKEWREANPDYRRNWDKANPDKVQSYTKGRHYHKRRALKQWGMKIEDLELILDQQEGRCAICQKEISLKAQTAFMDHCHKDNKFRGLLCNACNLGLGCFKDDIAILSNAVKYLRS